MVISMKLNSTPKNSMIYAGGTAFSRASEILIEV